jgi:hypothetical protein
MVESSRSLVNNILRGEIMADLQQVIDESRPMLQQFLCDIGIHRAGFPLDFPALLEPFSRWVDAQEVAEDARFHLASRLAAFMCEYLIEVRGAQRVIEGGRILLRIPVLRAVFREFDPFAVAVGMATNRNSLKAFLDGV